VTMTSQPGKAPAGAEPSGGPRGSHPAGLTIAGFRIRLTWGAYVLCALVVLTGALTLPAVAPAWPAALYLVATAGLVAGVLTSLAVHELAHAVVARRYGAATRELSLGFFGGTWHGGHEFGSPREQGRVAAAGPAASLALGAVFGAAALGAAALGAATGWVAVLGAIAWVSGLFAAVSSLPSAGLDGGLMVHALAWSRTGGQSLARIVAARVGTCTGTLLAAGGVILLVLGYLEGAWALLAGLVMAGASRAQGRRAQAITALAGLHVHDLLPPGAPTVAVPGWQTVSFLDAEFADGRAGAAGLPGGPWAASGGMVAFPVRDFEGRPSGLLTLAQLVAVPPARRGSLRVSDVATPIGQVVTTTPDEPLDRLVSRLAVRPATPAAVYTAGHALVLGPDGAPAGVLTPADFGRAAQFGALLAATSS
jgi:Zn-dependent protease/CBS domain-containing protein